MYKIIKRYLFTKQNSYEEDQIMARNGCERRKGSPNRWRNPEKAQFTTKKESQVSLVRGHHSFFRNGPFEVCINISSSVLDGLTSQKS